MASIGETILRHRSIEDLERAGLLGPGKPVQHAHSIGAVRIPVPPLSAGALFLENWQSRELPDQDVWRQPYYESVAPPMFVLHDVLVHSSAGIVAVGDQVISETLAHTRPEAQNYRNLARGIAIKRRSHRELGGVHITVLAAGADNYYHSMLLGLARLAAVPENYQAAAAGLLVPQGGMRQRDMLPLMDLMPSMVVHDVAPDETLRVETLILPLSVSGDSAYHPCVAEFFRSISTNVPPSSERMPRRIYLDRRGSPMRKLVNENALVAALERMGFVAVDPGLMSIPDPIVPRRRGDRRPARCIADQSRLLPARLRGRGIADGCLRELVFPAPRGTDASELRLRHRPRTASLAGTRSQRAHHAVADFGKPCGGRNCAERRAAAGGLVQARSGEMSLGLPGEYAGIFAHAPQTRRVM
jgi:hypothetical protein